MKPKAEKRVSPPLKRPEVQDFQAIEAWSSSQWIFSSERGGRTITRGEPFDPAKPLKRSLPPALQISSAAYHTNKKVYPSPFTSRQP